WYGLRGREPGKCETRCRKGKSNRQFNGLANDSPAQTRNWSVSSLAIDRVFTGLPNRTSSTIHQEEVKEVRHEIETETVCDNIYFGATSTRLFVVHPLSSVRSEERRVGKECRSRWSTYY